MITAAGAPGVSVIDEAAVRRFLTPRRAVDALLGYLVSGEASIAGPSRTVFDAPGDDNRFLIMPFASERWLGVKVLSALPEPREGRPTISGTYLVFDPYSGELVAIIDGTALTAVRTSALTALALEQIAHPDATEVVVFGTGVQAFEHIRTLVGLERFASFTIIGRDTEKAERLAGSFVDAGVPVRAGGLSALGSADVVVCCTTASEPLFDGDVIKPTAAVAAMGSYQLTSRELDEGLIGRSTVYVESVETALEEAGDIHNALARGTISVGGLRTLHELVSERVDYTRPRVFKSCGMSWEDLAVATELLRLWRNAPLGEESR